MLLNFLEKIAEMFPKEHYQSRLDNYLADKQIKSGRKVIILLSVSEYLFKPGYH